MKSDPEATSEAPNRPGPRPEASAEIARFAKDPDFMTSLARGLAVLRSFADHPRGVSTSQISLRTGISRAAVRRCLVTLRALGYVHQEGSVFRLTPKTLSLGHAYLSSATLASLAQPMLDRLRDRFHESFSLGVLEGDELVYVARAETQRIMSVALRVGSRLPAYCTSMGRVLLAGLAAEERERSLAKSLLIARTDRTLTDPQALLSVLETVRSQGHAVTDQELELGLRSIAVPVRGGDNRVIAALNVGVPAARVPLSDLSERLLPELVSSAAQLSLQLGAEN